MRGYVTLKGPVAGLITSRVIGSGPAAWSSCEGDELVSDYWIEGAGTTDGEDWRAEMDVEVERC